jgi:hypothetical protein
VVLSAPFHLILLVDTKFEPVTVKVKAEPPAYPEVGLMLEMEGTGLLVIVKVLDPEVPPPEVNTVTVADPADLMSVVGILAVSWVDET